MGLLFGWSCRGIEIRCSEKNIVGLWINLQRLSPVLGLNGFNLAELVWRIFMVNVQHAFARRYEQHAGRRFEIIATPARRNRIRLEDLSCVGVHHGHELWPATGRE